MTISIKATRGNSGSGDPTSISGPTVIIKGATNTYTITDYDSFSVYEVTSSAGTVSRTNETITLMVATDEVNNTLQLTVSRDGNIVVKNIAIGAQVIATPNITSPASGSVDVSIPTSLLATAFTSYPTGADTHVSSDWRVKNTDGEIVWQSLSNTVDKTSITIPASNLAPGTQYFAEVRYNSNVLGSSSYSPPVQFTTSVVFIVRPSITSPVSGVTGVAATPTFIATAFATNPIGSDTHASSDWRLKDSLGAITWSSNTDTVNKTSITLPSGVLAVSSQYTMEVRYNGSVLQPSQWSPVVSFTTAATFAFTKFLAVGSWDSPYLDVYGQDIDTFTKLPQVADVPAGVINSCSFSPAGDILLIAGNKVPYIKAFLRSGDNFSGYPIPVTGPSGGAGSGRGAAFSSDGVYAAVARSLSSGGQPLYVLKNMGDMLNPVALTSVISATHTGVSWASTADGHYLAASHDVSPFISIYKRAGDTFTKLANPAALPAGDGESARFSPDGGYLVVGHAVSPFISIYKRAGDTFTKLANPAALPTNPVLNTAFSPDGAYMCVSHAVSPFISIYKRAGDTFTKLANPAALPAAASRGCSFSSDGNYLAVTSDSTNPYLLIYKRAGDTFTKLANPAALPTIRGWSTSFCPPVLGS